MHAHKRSAVLGSTSGEHAHIQQGFNTCPKHTLFLLEYDTFRLQITLESRVQCKGRVVKKIALLMALLKKMSDQITPLATLIKNRPAPPSLEMQESN